LAFLSEESTSEKDAKAEKAGKKVAKDIEYDEGHKGKDDNKAEKAGKKVTKDIEYDDKKDKKVDESYANSADDTFEADIDFMTKVISGGLNRQKSTGQTTIPVIAGQRNRMGVDGLGSPMKESTDLLKDYMKLSGL
jgi:ferredoxin-thioredoxin reductase catalytic subunit